MATLEVHGLDELMFSFEQIAEIPDEVATAMLDAEADVVVAAHKASIRKLGLVDTGTLAGSIKAHRKRSQGKRYVLVYPYGDHSTYNRREVTKVYKNSKSGRTYTVGGDVKKVTNNDVGFIHEVGAPNKGIEAKQWMRIANEECADEAVAAARAVYDNWLTQKGL